MKPTPCDGELIAAVAHGLPMVPRPFAAIADALGSSEAEVIARLESLAAAGVIRRFGIVVRHHELGFNANAMVVWDVPDDRTFEAAQRIMAFPFVTLCYRRPRRPPHWPYNLFCMIHGRDRAAVERLIEVLTRETGLSDVRCAVLFSRRRFKQCGARYGAAAQPGPAPDERAAVLPAVLPAAGGTI